MDSNLSLSYDRTGDSLLIVICPPYPEQETEELGDGLLARFNPDTNDIEAIEIFFFSQRLQTDRPLQLPLWADLRLAIAP
ncbi:DUF2283 domain-containing protein [Limnothrix sp. FACHB-708]|uniref:DUF2283 domain-containing protein n=1 Tax=unclassified Limnothrix TaxID=2632864 RepID=UPI001689008C|nr:MULTISPECIES: DUF2283 domain-containing protein [unclassified Limnothrix]MBD2552908.1 DUF2283 domain-containing protein [Limnothrix sp. FACHB-708]MBD2589280.1 DUF2283 domain-containing protein [Limnothrix sp. FACHB-406]